MYHEIIVDAAQLASNEKLSTSFTLYYCIQLKKCTVHVTFQSSVPYFEIIVDADQLASNEKIYSTSFVLYYCTIVHVTFLNSIPYFKISVDPDQLIWIYTLFFLPHDKARLNKSLDSCPNFVKNWGGWEVYIFIFFPTALMNRTVLKKKTFNTLNLNCRNE